MKGDGKKLYSFVEVDESSPIQKLSILDQLRVLLKHLSYDAANELKNEDIVTQEYMRLKSNCLDFIYRATDPIRRGEKRSVIVNISSMFDPVIDECLKSSDVQNYFDVREVRPRPIYGIPFDIMVEFKVKAR